MVRKTERVIQGDGGLQPVLGGVLAEPGERRTHPYACQRALDRQAELVLAAGLGRERR
jgi:hypothetical protein